MFERYTSKLLLSPKTSIGGYVFDIYQNINHNSTATITSHPTQFGANISDHKFDEPDVLTFQIGMSDCSQDLIAGQFNNRGSEFLSALKDAKSSLQAGDKKKDILLELKSKTLNILSESRSVNAYITLQRLKLYGIPMTCVTRLKTYDNMIIQSINADDTVETKNGLRATVTMREILVAELQKVQVTSTAQITQTTSKGSTNALDFDLSAKKQFSSTDYDEYGLGDF